VIYTVNPAANTSSLQLQIWRPSAIVTGRLSTS
jgi:hypothetical protein